MNRRGVVRLGALGLVVFARPDLLLNAARADPLDCLPVKRMAAPPDTPPANKRIGVSVAYLKVPFYANFKSAWRMVPSTSVSHTTSSMGTVGTWQPSSRICRISSLRNMIS